ncbi:MAG TPA: phospho-N-acetylmuramoyl-pentapeptide-transferase [Firmicutes bacterium]|nr:phospho-N-acetylmuramoyl-pentapeptide-transferase [Bacillota bacterium]
MTSQVYVLAFTAFILSVVFSPIYIRFSRSKQFGQQVRSDGPRRHFHKAGTPTMGGIVILFSLLISLFFGVEKTPFLILAVGITLTSAFLGFLDDYRKVVRRTSLGLKAREKLAGQFVFSVVFYLVLLYLGHSTVVDIPFSTLQIDFGLAYPLLIFLMIVAASNAVNLTDGIDGLAGGTSIIAFLAFLLLASMQGLQDMALFCGTMIGAIFGFLIFNLHPARVFMGDVGSLSLGAALAAAAILTKAEFYLAIIGGVFVLETLSVILQVISFQLTGKRILLMAPLHHHFEMKGWSEWQVVTGFWALGFVFAIMGLLDFPWPLR